LCACVSCGVTGDHVSGERRGDLGAPGDDGGTGGVFGGGEPGGGGGAAGQLDDGKGGSSLLSCSDALHVVRVASSGGLSSLH